MDSKDKESKLATTPELSSPLWERDNMSYFSGLIGDERLNTAFENGEYTHSFSFYGETMQVLHPLMPQIDDLNVLGNPVTKYTATGAITGTHNETSLRLEIARGHNAQSNSFSIEQKGEDLYIIDEASSYVEQLSLDDFINLSFRVADINPKTARRTLKLLRQDKALMNVKNFYSFWSDLAEEKRGMSTQTGIIRKVLSKEDDVSIIASVFKEEKELPRRSEFNLIIEHSTLMHSLDVEQSYRLELGYSSDISHTQWASAEKRITSGCALQLVSARMISKKPKGLIHELDINDSALMNQFKITLELLLTP